MSSEETISDALVLLARITELKQIIRSRVGLIEAECDVVANESYLESVIEYVDETFCNDIQKAKQALERGGYKAPMSDREIEMMKGIV